MPRLLVTILLAGLPIAYASPPFPGPSKVPNAIPAGIAAERPLITPSPSLQDPTKTVKLRRGVADDIKSGFSDVQGYVSSQLGALPSYVADGVANFFQGFPVGDDVKSSLGLDDEQIAALPTQVLNIPYVACEWVHMQRDPTNIDDRSYGNWTDQGWNLRFRGNVYKKPNISREKLDDLANAFLIDTSIDKLPPSQADQARNLTAAIFVLQQKDRNVTFSLAPAPTAGASGEQGGGGAVTPGGGNQEIKFPYETTLQGDFDAFVPIDGSGLSDGNSTNQIQRLNVYTKEDKNGGATPYLGNATSYLVPPKGLTIISDIDDILRVTKIYDPKEGLLNSFARPFTQWMNMPDIYANWSRSIPDFHFHYLTTTPEQVTRNYMDFIYKTYPGGSFDTRPLNFSDVSATLSIRRFLLDKIFLTYPERQFILMADTSNSDVMKAYPAMAKDYPGQVKCIFLRNTSATDDSDHFPYDTSGFEGIVENSYMFFNVPVSSSVACSSLLHHCKSRLGQPIMHSLIGRIIGYDDS